MELESVKSPRPARFFPPVICVLALAASGCEREVRLAQIPLPKVSVSQPVQRELGDFGEFTGRVEAVENVEVRARVTGYLDAVKFVEGDVVEEGAELFKIDPRPFEAVLEAAQAEIDRWNAQIVKTQADFNRQNKLHEKKVATQEDLDGARAAKLNAEASLRKAKAAVVSANLDVQFTTIRAPVKGRVSRAMVTRGNLVAADQSLGLPLTTIVSVDPMYVYFDVDEYTILEIMSRSRARGEETSQSSRVRDRKIPVFIRLANETGFPHTGLLDFIDNRVDPDTGTLRARARFDNADEFLVAGMFVRVRVPLGDPKQQVLVPDHAIGTDLNQKYVLVVNQKHVVEKRPVTLGVRTDDGLRTVLTGLSPDAWVITNGIQRVRETDTVESEKVPITGEETRDNQKAEAGTPDKETP